MRLMLAALTVTSLVFGACAPASEAARSITVYSGRSETLVAPLIARFEELNGVTVDVRYGDSAELAVLLLEEGTRTPADVFFAQDAGSLGAVAETGLLATLPQEALDRVPAAFRASGGGWVGITGRARVLVYDPRELGQADLPASVDDLTDPQWRGRIGWAPTNGSFQAFVTAFRLLRGDDAARQWLEGMLANQPRRYEGNAPIVQAIADGEIDVGLVNHYYALRAQAEQGADLPVRNHFFAADDPGTLINVAGAAVLAPSTNEQLAQDFIAYLLSDDAQRYFAEQTFEYPLTGEVDPPAGVPALELLDPPDIDLSNLSDLQGTLTMLTDVGVLP